MTSRIGLTAVLMAAFTLTACGGPPESGQIYKDEIICDVNCETAGGDVGGGGTTTVPSTAVRLAAFQDSSVSGNYYEIRETFYNSLGQSVGYNPQKWDGDAMARGTFVPQVVAQAMPCGGHVTVDIGVIGFFNSWTRVTPIFSISTPGTYTFPNAADPYGMGLISYSWNGCN